MQRINAGHPRNASPGSRSAEIATDAPAQHTGVVRLQQAPAGRAGIPASGTIRFDFTKADNALDFLLHRREAAAA